LPLAARAESHYLPREIIDRPLLLPSNVVELDVLGNLSSTSGASAGAAAAVGIELGLGDGEAGLVVALPAVPGLGFGSVYGSAAWSIRKDSAFRIDLGLDHSQGDVGRPNENFYTAGAGLIVSWRLAREWALTLGQTRAINFSRFVNVSLGGTGFYTGATAGFDSADLVVYSKEEDGPTQISGSAPFGLLWQIDHGLAATFRFGYELVVSTDGDRNGTQHFIPVGVDVVVTPVPTLDVGASLSLAGQIAQTGASASAGFTDAPMGALWLRLRL
jgi:hypothetical protein